MTFTRMMIAVGIIGVPQIITILLTTTTPSVYSVTTYDVVQTDENYLTECDSDSLYKYSVYVKGKSDKEITKLNITKHTPCIIAECANRAEIVERVRRFKLGVFYADLPDYQIYLPLEDA